VVAGHALQGLIAHAGGVQQAVAARDELAQAAYQLADAMLEARERVLSPSLRPAPSTSGRRSPRGA